MIKPKHFRRLFGLAAVLFLVFISLGARLVFLQVVRHDHYRKIADNNTQSLSVRPARRGDILDARGNPLAVSLPVKRVIANPAFMGTHYLEVAHRLAPLLAYQEADLAQRLRPTVVRTNQFGLLLTNQYVDLKRKLTIEQWQQVTQSMASLRIAAEPIKPTGAQKQFYRALREQSVFPVDDQYRYYPNTNLASHVIGYAQDTETNFNSNVIVRELTGRDGIEAWLDAKLRGIHGWRITETDHGKREIFAAREQEVDARPGLNVVLTLDSVIQSIVEAEIADAARKHSPISVSSMVVRPRTGEILAMATLPNYDPNQPGRAPLDALRNRMISDVVEPGSTFKIVVVSAALNENVVTLDDTFDCEMGNFRFLGHILHDHDHHGVITVENIITHSSNIGSAKIGIRLGKDLLDQYIRRFGFGAKTGITLGGELPGIVHPLSYYDKDKLLISRIPMGQAIAVTPLQMTMAMCAIANEGRVMRPMLVSRLQDPEGNVCAQYEPQVVRQAVRPEAARLLVSALKTVVAKGGTAPQAAMDHYTVAGKTGTAWKVVDRVYVHGKYISSFIGFFPADNPEVCISVFFDEPKNGYYGGSTAAPVFRKIADQVANYLKIKPEQQEPGTDTEAALGTLKTASLAGPQ